MSSNAGQSLPNLRTFVGENRLYEVKHRFEDQVADGSRALVRSILRTIDDRQVTTIQILDENTGNILEEYPPFFSSFNFQRFRTTEEMEDFMDDWNEARTYLKRSFNEVCENLREFNPSLHSVLNRFASLDF